MPLRVPWPLGEGPVWRLGKVVLLLWVCGSGLVFSSLQLLVGSWVGYPTYSLVSAEDLSRGYPLRHGA